MLSGAAPLIPGIYGIDRTMEMGPSQLRILNVLSSVGPLIPGTYRMDRTMGMGRSQYRILKCYLVLLH